MDHAAVAQLACVSTAQEQGALHKDGAQMDATTTSGTSNAEGKSAQGENARPQVVDSAVPTSPLPQAAAALGKSVHASYTFPSQKQSPS